MKKSGLSDVGFEYVNLDDCWGVSTRDSHNVTQANSTKFPSGIPALSSLLHSLGLKFGIYSDAGTRMCLNDSPGGYGYEDVDARTYAEWGVDYLKYDDCNAQGLPYIPRYTAMRDALARTGRPILYSLCAARFNRYQPMWSRVIGNSWRTTTDIGTSWASVMFNLDGNNQWWQWAGRGGWSDPDMLRVGQGFLSDDEEVSHFSLWCLIKAPLIMGHDLTQQTTRTVQILTNTELIALNQDPLGRQGRLVLNDTQQEVQVWAVALDNGDVAAVLLNRHNSLTKNVTARWGDLDIIPEAAEMHVRDLWLHQDMGIFNVSYTATLRPHQSVTIRLQALDPNHKTTVPQATAAEE